MRNQITENKEFNIISRSIDNAEKCTVIKIEDDCFKVKLHGKQKYETGESVELFSSDSSDKLYFETLIKCVEDDILSVWFPISLKHIQKREYTRVKIEKEVTLKNENKEINAKIIDISADGMKIISQEQVQLLTDYEISINIKNKIIQTLFEPIRIEAEANGFISSGRFKKIDNYDRIALVQYCFGKQIENNNK